MAPGPGCQPADCAIAAGTDASSSAIKAATNAAIRGRAKRIAALLRKVRSTALKPTSSECATAPKGAPQLKRGLANKADRTRLRPSRARWIGDSDAGPGAQRE